MITNRNTVDICDVDYDPALNHLIAFVLVDNNNNPVKIDGLSDGILDDLPFTVFSSDEHADNARYIQMPKCGEGCCYDLPYIGYTVKQILITIELLDAKEK